MNTKVIKRKELTDNCYITHYTSRGREYYAVHVTNGTFPLQSKIYRGEEFNNFLEFEKHVWCCFLIEDEDEDIMLSNPIFAATWDYAGIAVKEWLEKF